MASRRIFFLSSWYVFVNLLIFTSDALSIYGQEVVDNCPFKTGNGYGDGRAISVGEVVSLDTGRWELQLKGAGRTPFCRGADGRAVLRSSVREFLASEAMHALDVATTRALSLVVSDSETVKRPWYSGETKSDAVPQMDDPRLATFPPETRRALLGQLAQQMRDPDQMRNESIAITCRVAPSFIRVGHLELFSRRARRASVDSIAHRQLEQLARHALWREFPAQRATGDNAPLQPQLLAMLREASRRMSILTADWLRVGFCQGNFNSDNCLVAGRTMDYGPFGFVERFEPLWCMWVGGGRHFGFLNQPEAGTKNVATLVKALSPLLDSQGKAEAEEVAEQHHQNAVVASYNVWARKLGLPESNPGVPTLVAGLFQLMEETQADFTLVWRQLAEVVDTGLVSSLSEGLLLSPFLDKDAFYSPLTSAGRNGWAVWLRVYLDALGPDADRATVAATMRAVSPKYVPREWMLKAAYDAANATPPDYGPLKELHQLFTQPYAEQKDFEAKYYRRAPSSVYEGVGQGGVAYMS